MIIIGTTGPISQLVLAAVLAALAENKIEVRHAVHISDKEATQAIGTAQDLQGDLLALGASVTLVQSDPAPEKKKGGGGKTPQKPKSAENGEGEEAGEKTGGDPAEKSQPAQTDGDEKQTGDSTES